MLGPPTRCIAYRIRGISLKWRPCENSLRDLCTFESLTICFFNFRGGWFLELSEAQKCKRPLESSVRTLVPNLNIVYRVMLIGGRSSALSNSASVITYDPVTNSFTTEPDMITHRNVGACTLFYRLFYVRSTSFCIS